MWTTTTAIVNNMLDEAWIYAGSMWIYLTAWRTFGAGHVLEANFVLATPP
jgi:hypothetical protein